MSDTPQRDWNPGTYDRFRGLRLRPALDLLAAVGEVPAGEVTDLGCGSGAAGPMLQARFPGRRVTGVDASPAMLEAARATAAYDALMQADLRHWRPGVAPALIFCNAVLHWLPDHADLLPRLVAGLRPGGVLAVQVPGMNDAPSHAVWRELSGRAETGPGILTPAEYHRVLAPLGAVEVWETTYLHRLDAAEAGHPVRHFTQATYGRPFLDGLSENAAARLCARYDARMAEAYPCDADGSVLFPFRRVFFTLRV